MGQVPCTPQVKDGAAGGICEQASLQLACGRCKVLETLGRRPDALHSAVGGPASSLHAADGQVQQITACKPGCQTWDEQRLARR